MLAPLRPLFVSLSALAAIVLLPATRRAHNPAPPSADVQSATLSARRSWTRTANAELSIRLVIWTDRPKYPLSEELKLNAVLRNEGKSTVYVARRMAGFWDGGNLGIEISDEQGNHIPLPFRTHVPPPPPKEGDTSFLLPLDSGHSYGSWFALSVKDFFHNPGKYSIRITYHNWLPKEFIPRKFRGQPVLGADTPSIVSEPLWIEVTDSAARP